MSRKQSDALYDYIIRRSFPGDIGCVRYVADYTELPFRLQCPVFTGGRTSDYDTAGHRLV